MINILYNIRIYYIYIFCSRGAVCGKGGDMLFSLISVLVYFLGSILMKSRAPHLVGGELELYILIYNLDFIAQVAMRTIAILCYFDLTLAQ